jgi:hypothetical protein
VSRKDIKLTSVEHEPRHVVDTESLRLMTRGIDGGGERGKKHSGSTLPFRSNAFPRFAGNDSCNDARDSRKADLLQYVETSKASPETTWVTELRLFFVRQYYCAEGGITSTSYSYDDHDPFYLRGNHLTRKTRPRITH